MAQKAIQNVAVIERTMMSLLENSLPKAVIPRLIASEFKFSTVSDRIDNAYCLFIDFFEPKVIKSLDAESIASALNETFSTFDELLVAFPMIEKIKTITSKCLLMAVAEPDKPSIGSAISDLVEKVVSQFDGRLCTLANDRRCVLYKVRIGVALGAVVAGIVGEEKFIYDIYSDTVNCASRMATLTETRVACTWETYISFSVASKPLWRSLGILNVKGKGKMEVFSLVALDSLDLDNTLPTYNELNPPITYKTKFTSNEETASMLQKQNRKHVTIFDQIHPGFALLSSPKNFPETSRVSMSIFSLSILPTQSTDLDRNQLQQQQQQMTMLSLTNASTKRQKQSGRHVAPVDMSKYLNVSIGALDTTTKSNQQLAALNDIITEMAPLIETATTDSLQKLLSRHITRFTLKFKDNEIEIKYRNCVKGRLQAHAKQHSNAICYMMTAFALIVPLYEEFFPGQLGFDIEQQIRDGAATIPPESESERRNRYIAAAIIVIIAVIQIGATIALSADIHTQSEVQVHKDSHDSSLQKQNQKSGYMSKLFSGMKTLFGSSDQPRLGHIQYTAHITLVLIFGITLLTGTTYSDAYWAVGAIFTMLDSAISLMSGLTVDFRTRLLVSLFCDLGVAIIRNFIESVSYVEWLFAICSVFTSMFVVYQTEYSEKVGFLLEETLRSLQINFDRRAFVSAGLLKAVIPKRLINRLAVDTDQSLIVEEFPMITILHLDIVSFTVLSGTLQPIELIKLLNAIFSKFDQICKKHEVEKILTIGDAYIAAKLCEPNINNLYMSVISVTAVADQCEAKYKTNAEAVCLVGLDMQRELSSKANEYQGVSIRVGVHSGPASGFITGGTTKLKYELIGDTVDVAEKVQEKAHPGSVFASQTTVSLMSPVDDMRTFNSNSGVSCQANLCQSLQRPTLQGSELRYRGKKTLLDIWKFDDYAHDCFTRAYHTEMSFRIQFSGLKMAQKAIQSVAIIEKTMMALLENSLPKSVIPRLIASEFQFSTVSDRIDHAYCIFIDFFESNVIKNLDPQSVGSALNETFSTFDELLVTFPMIEKIKTITSKCLLMAVAEPDKSSIGSAMSDLVEKVVSHFDGRHCSLANDRRGVSYKVRIGVAFGPVVAGIVGEEKFIYDIYSDTVNCAENRVACTSKTYDSLNVAISKNTDKASYTFQYMT
ncbi:hypothetical protein HDU76_000555 [Blyttiomyces sp. JEL0837]|nr:hypothetical protein HDU76_000555 [Blyttiomyces sp. JEL0837]